MIMSFDRMQFDSSLYVLLETLSDRRALRGLLGMEEGIRRHRKYPELDPAGWSGYRDEPSTRAYKP